MTTIVTPPSLSYFCIFNPTFCYSDETLFDQIFFYASRAEAVSADEQLRKVGLIQGILSFASDFSNRKPVEIIDTRKTRTVVVEIEPNWWMALCVNFTRIQSPVSQSSSAAAASKSNGSNGTNNSSSRNGSASNSNNTSTSASSKTKNSIKTTGKIVGGEVNSPAGDSPASQSRVSALSSFRRKKKVEMRTDYSRKEVPGCNVLHSQLIRGYNQWKMLNGRYPASYVRDEAKEKAMKDKRRMADERRRREDEALDRGESEEAAESRDKFDEQLQQQLQAADDAAEQALDELAEFRMNLRKFWSWWLHKWELYTFSSATWGGTLNNSFLAHGLTLGSVPTLSFSFMDYAVGIKMGGPGRISDLTAEAIKAIVKREERNGMVDLVITRMSTFSVVAPGGSLLKSSATSGPQMLNGDQASINGDAESLYSRGDDAASIMSSRSRRSRFFDRRTESLAGQSEYTATSEYSDNDAVAAATLIDEQYALEEEMRNGCVFQGAGYISRTSIAEYSRWIIDNHIFPSPAAVEGVRWSLYSNVEDPLWPFSALLFSFRYGYKRPVPPKIKKKSSKKSKKDGSKKRGSVASIESAAAKAGSTGNSNNSAAAKHLLDSSLGLLSKVTSASTASTTIATVQEKMPPHEIRDDLSDAKFLVGLQGGLDMDAMFDDEDEDEDEDEDGEDGEGRGGRRAPPEITMREVYMLRKRKKNREVKAQLALPAPPPPPSSEMVKEEVEEDPVVTPVSPGKADADGDGDTTIGADASVATIVVADQEAQAESKSTLAPPSTLADSVSTLASTTSTIATTQPSSSSSSMQQKHERLMLVIYKRAPFVFSAFFDPEKGKQALANPAYYRGLHLRLGTLVEPIFEDLENGG
ncbi:hypothetical protein BZA70DRAFT_277828 [Myxozyma melibiosi]|uniref:CCZ1/INTU/HSP4 first Longin domain-containing protein n=1 Tax=Myxozyma melibiosi TaxID=54550 RepID=A0ABR1F643_9ASCO